MNRCWKVLELLKEIRANTQSDPSHVNIQLKLWPFAKKWAQNENFHLRRLGKEGLRPKLPWAPKLDVWKQGPGPVFGVLEILKEDKVKFVKKSVVNHKECT